MQCLSQANTQEPLLFIKIWAGEGEYGCHGSREMCLLSEKVGGEKEGQPTDHHQGLVVNCATCQREVNLWDLTLLAR